MSVSEEDKFKPAYVKFYDFKLGESVQDFRLGIFVNLITFENYKNLYEVVYPKENRDESVCRDILHQLRSQNLILFNDFRAIANKNLYSDLAAHTCQYFGRNLKNKNINLGQFSLSRSTSANSVNTLNFEESPTKEEKIQVQEMSGQDLLNKMPKYDPSTYTFRAYRRKAEAYFSWHDLEDQTKQLKLIEYAVSGFDKESTILGKIKKSLGVTDYSKILDRMVLCVDGSVVLTKAQATKKAFKLQLHNYQSAKDYHNEFINLQAGCPDLEEEVVIEAFVDGCNLGSIKNTLEHHIHNQKLLDKEPDLYEMFELLETLYTKKDRVNVNSAQFNFKSSKNSYGNANNRYPQNSFNNHNNNNNRNNYNSSGQNHYPARKNNNPHRNKTCKTCFRKGHIQRFCPNKQKIRAFMAEVQDSGDEGLSGGQNHHENDQDSSKECVFGQSENKNDIFSNKDPPNSKIVTSEMVSDQFNDIVSSRTASDLVENAKIGDSRELDIVQQSSNDDLMDYHVNFHYHKLIVRRFILKSSLKETIWSPYIDTGAQRSVMSRQVAEEAGFQINKNVNFRVFGFDQA